MNKIIDLYEKDNQRNLTDQEVMEAAASNKEKLPLVRRDSRGGIVVSAPYDLAVHFAKCCSPIPGDEIVGFVTRPRNHGSSDGLRQRHAYVRRCDRGRLIEAEWQVPDDEKGSETYAAEINVYAENRTGLLVDISRIFTERKIDIGQMNVRTNKQGTATLEMSFNVHSREELGGLIKEIKKIRSIMDIDRKTG